MDEYLRKVGFHRSESDDTLYMRQQGKYIVILIMYVDDLIISGNNDDHIAQVKKELHAGFKMTDLGLLHYYLGVEVFQRPLRSSFPGVNMQQKFFSNLECRIVSLSLPLWNKT